MKALVKQVRLPGIKNHKMKVMLKEKGRENAMEVKSTLVDIFETHGVKINGEVPYVTIERPPAVQERYQEFGKMLAAVQGVPGAKDKLMVEWYPQFTIYMKDPDNNQEPACLGQLANNGPAWRNEVVTRLLGKTGAEMDLAFRA
eukprot:8723157-Karenia_brevis.AAC.1